MSTYPGNSAAKDIVRKQVWDLIAKHGGLLGDVGFLASAEGCDIPVLRAKGVTDNRLVAVDVDKKALAACEAKHLGEYRKYNCDVTQLSKSFSGFYLDLCATLSEQTLSTIAWAGKNVKKAFAVTIAVGRDQFPNGAGAEARFEAIQSAAPKRFWVHKGWYYRGHKTPMLVAFFADSVPVLGSVTLERVTVDNRGVGPLIETTTEAELRAGAAQVSPLDSISSAFRLSKRERLQVAEGWANQLNLAAGLEPEVTPHAPTSAIQYEGKPLDSVELNLAQALSKAASLGQWQTVEEIAQILKRRT